MQADLPSPMQQNFIYVNAYGRGGVKGVAYTLMQAD
jgi:hypothetical protein